MMSKLFFLLFLITVEGMGQSIVCVPDKGIKLAVLTGSFSEEGSSKKDKFKESQEIEYNKEGLPIVIRYTKDGTTHRRIYEEGKLTHIITSRKKDSDFSFNDQSGSSQEEAEFVTDTVKILKHHADGRMLEMNDHDGMIWLFEYEGCEKEIITTVYPNGDTLQQVKNVPKNDVLVEHIWIAYSPAKSNYITRYFDYKFNKSGDWIKRSKNMNGRTFIESRKLKYY